MSKILLLMLLALIVGVFIWFEFFYKGEKEPIEDHEKIW